MTKEEIEAKLKEEGINEKLGSGLSFDKPEDLDSWIESFKTTEESRIEEFKTKLEKKKGIDEYTADELKEILKKPHPEAKGLQSLIDGLKAEMKDEKKKKDEDGKSSTELDSLKEQIKTLTDALSELKTTSEKKSKEEKFNELFSKYGKGVDDVDKKYIRATLNVDSSEEDVKKAFSDYKALMAKRGFKDFGVDSSNKHKEDEKEDKDMAASVKRLLKEKEQEQKTD